MDTPISRPTRQGKQAGKAGLGVTRPQCSLALSSSARMWADLYLGASQFPSCNSRFGEADPHGSLGVRATPFIPSFTHQTFGTYWGHSRSHTRKSSAIREWTLYPQRYDRPQTGASAVLPVRKVACCRRGQVEGLGVVEEERTGEEESVVTRPESSASRSAGQADDVSDFYYTATETGGWERTALPSGHSREDACGILEGKGCHTCPPPQVQPRPGSCPGGR